jgi:hypothetical protein
MACQLVYSQNGKLNKVLNEKGEPSKLFGEVFNTPILTLEESVEIYKSTYSEKVRKGKSESELTLIYETPSEKSYSSYQEALQNTSEGKIQLKTNGVLIAEVKSSTDISDYNGVLNHLIKQGALTGERILDVNGDQIFVVSGESDSAKQLTSNIAENIAVKTLGQSSVKRLDTGDFLFENNLNTRIINGEKVNEVEIAEMDYEQLKKRFSEDVAISIEVERQFEKDMLPTQLKKRLDEDTDIKSEDDLTKAIKTLLNKLGINITSIEDYEKNNTIKNGGVNPSSSALMDVVNKIMAFRNGTITNEDLIEETMHLIEASLDPTLTVGLRKNIHNSPEWKEHSKHYYEIYSKEYSGDKLEEMVRREILGKVMANGIATNFALSQEDTQVQQSIFNKIKELLQQFFNRVNTYFTEDYQKQINQLNKDIYVKLLSGELASELDVNQNFGTKFRLYSASTNLNNELVQIQKQAESALTILESQAYQISKNDASQRQQIRSAKESLGKVAEQFGEIEKIADIVDRNHAEKIVSAELAATFSYITNVAQKQLTYLQRAVKKNKDSSFHFSSEEQAVYQSMITQFDKYILPSITSTLESKQNRSRAEDRILEEVKKVSESIETLKKTVHVDQDTYKKWLVDTLATRLGLSADKRTFIENQVNSKQKDTNFFFQNFGNLMHSSNLFLNSVGHVINKMDYERRQATLDQTLPFVKKLKDSGYLAGNKLREFAKNGYIQNRFDDKAREEAAKKAHYDIYKEISGSAITYEEFAKKTDFSDLTVAQKSLMTQRISDWQLDNYTLSPLSAEEMRERKKKYENYSEVTQNYQNVNSKFYADLMSNAEVVDGIPRFTMDMKYDYEQNRKNHVYTKHIYDNEGTLRDGIEYRSEVEYNDSLITIEINENPVTLETNIIKVSNGVYASIIPGTTNSESILAFELSQIDNNRIAELKAKNEQKEFSPKFVETLSALNASEAYDFLNLNAYVGYSNEYYESLDRPSVISRLSEKLGEDNDWKIQDLIDKIAVTTKKLNTILQANRVMNNPSEINYDGMEKNSEVKMIAEYSALLEGYYSDASNIIGKRGEEIEEDNLSETIPNEAFSSYMSDNSNVSRLVYDKDVLDKDDVEQINKIFSAVLAHTTLKNAGNIGSLKNFVKNFPNGRENRIPKQYKRIFKLTEVEYGEMSEEQVFASMSNDLLQYSYTRLLPYFRKSQPIGVDLALNQLKNGILKASDFIENYQKGEYPFLNISPNYNFQQANEQNNKNPHFQQAKVQGTPMFRTFETSTTLEDVKTKSTDQLDKEGKLNKFVNKDFLKEYDIDLVKLFETGEEVSRKNNNKFDAREAFVELQKQTLGNYGKTNSHNIYQLPQKEKGRLRKWEDLKNKGGGLRNLLDEITSNREDESVLGQDSGGNTFKNMSTPTIPKFGLRKLSQGEATDELLESYIWMNNESNLYQARVKSIGDMLAIKEAMLGSEFEGNLKVEATNAYKMLEDQLKYNWYGQKEVFSKEFQLFGKTADMGQVLKSFGTIIRFKNLAYNVTIPITSFLTGSIQLRIEKIVGERVDASAFNRGKKRFYKEAGGAMRDVLSLESTSWLNAMGSKFGFYENEERYNNSDYGKLTRGLGRSAYVAHTVANFAPNSITALSVLSDFRFSDGKLIQYREFKENNKGKSDKEVRAVWENYKDILDVSLVDESGLIYYDYQKIADALNTNMTVEEVKTFMEGKDAMIAGVVKMGIQAVDGQVNSVDKNLISRNAFTSFLGIHRNWLFLAAQNRFKGRQFNTLTGNVEEGNYRAVWRVINDIVKDVKSGKTKDVLKYIKEKWESGNTTTKKNLIRAVTESSILQLMIGLTVLGMKELDDDSEDSYTFKLANLFLMRSTVELASSSSALSNNLYDVLSNATVGSNVIDMMFTAPEIFSSDVVTRGRFRDMTERQRYFLRNAPGVKDIYNLYDIENNINSYRHFNVGKEDNNLRYFTIFPLIAEE